MTGKGNLVFPICGFPERCHAAVIEEGGMAAVLSWKSFLYNGVGVFDVWVKERMMGAG